MRSIEEQRETAKLGLQTFFMEVENNHYDRISNEAIKIFEEKVEEIYSEIKKHDVEVSCHSGATLEVMFLEQELKAISEMKIIYAYKHFEIKLKFLLNAAYENVERTKMYKWEFIIDFLKSKKIDVKKIKAYNEINELRIVNNAIKHSNNFFDDSKVSLIKEFKGKKTIQYQDLLSFYKRIENSPSNFIYSLSDLIYNDLYVFDEFRINEFAESMALRMTKKEANSFIEKLKEKY